MFYEFLRLDPSITFAPTKSILSKLPVMLTQAVGPSGLSIQPVVPLVTAVFKHALVLTHALVRSRNNASDVIPKLERTGYGQSGQPAQNPAMVVNVTALGRIHAVLKMKFRLVCAVVPEPIHYGPRGLLALCKFFHITVSYEFINLGN